MFQLRQSFVTNPISQQISLLFPVCFKHLFTPEIAYGVKDPVHGKGGLTNSIACSSFKLLPRNGGGIWSTVLLQLVSTTIKNKVSQQRLKGSLSITILSHSVCPILRAMCWEQDCFLQSRSTDLPTISIISVEEILFPFNTYSTKSNTLLFPLLWLAKAKQTDFVPCSLADVAPGLAHEKWREELIRNLLKYKVLYNIV